MAVLLPVPRLFLVLLIVAAFSTGVFGESETNAENNTSLTSTLAISVIVLICLICAIFYCAGTPIVHRDPLPPWAHYIQPHPNLVSHGFNSVSDGLSITNPTTVVRHRNGSFETDGAKWSGGISGGKHVFEINWPENFRGTTATIGVGSINASLFLKPKGPLVGNDKLSRGLDISSKRVIHLGKPVKRCCGSNGHIPQQFYMYVDADSGNVGFGSSFEFWGFPIIGIPKDLYPLYVMIGVSVQGSYVQVTYRGTAPDPNVPGPTGGQIFLVQQPVLVQTPMPVAPPPNDGNQKY
ncbi:hypothetical protein CHS0354_039033 [Potamilus streckersoni]|uniref:Uncharacterized protein n=1 Tax=Potamilus streckersoni TaxID=2493646 RepID=A0AAE0VHZ4_9BIVA|nr:hypothetical protein CHS0354_039033 [Potamilus streckersoni]